MSFGGRAGACRACRPGRAERPSGADWYGKPLKFWYWIDHQADTSVLVLVLWAFVTGVVGTILIRTTVKTLRQIREMQERGRTEKMHRELRDMKAKAGMLRSKGDVPTADDATHETAE
jgi:hypothetical protein